MTDDTNVGNVARSGNVPNNVAQAARDIEEERKTIDNIDEQIIRLLAQRFQATRRVGELKAAAGFAALDETRETQQRERAISIADACGLDTEIAEAYVKFVVTESKKRHRKIADCS